MKLTRRQLLVGAAAGGGLLVAFSLLPRDYDNPIVPGPGEYAFDAWLKIAQDGVVTVAVPQLEMGQGVTTLLPQIVAMELGADWRQVAVEPAPVSGAYANLPLAARWAPLWRPAITDLADEPDDYFLKSWAEGERFSVTADGLSQAAYELPCRRAAASARALLAMAAAARWGVSWEECEVAGGFVRHGDNRLTFGELVAEAAALDPPDPAPLRPVPPRDPAMPLPTPVRTAAEAEDEEPDGPVTAFPRLDLPSKVDGTFTFAGDVRLPDMVFAAIRHGPRDQAELVGFDAQRAARVDGLVGIVRGKRWLAAAATNWWAAEQALTAMAPRFAAERMVRSDRIEAALDEGVRRGEGVLVGETGDGNTGYAPDIAHRYSLAAAVHATLETATVTARLEDGRLELWMATQAPEMARRAAARAIGLSLADVVLYPMPAGGSFDRRLEHDQAIEAALIARELEKPVQLVWSRAEEQLALQPRPPALGLVSAQLTADGRIAAMRTRVATPPAAQEFGRRLFANMTGWAAIDAVAGEADPLALEGYLGVYGIEHQALYHVPVELPLPSGRMRGNAHGLTCFLRESFVDEVAAKGGHEPLGFRVAMLGHDPRLVACLQRAAGLAAWDGGARGTGQGIACHVMRLGEGEDAPGGRIAVVATASVGEGGLKISKLAAALDIGRVVNRDLARQQVEGGLLFGLGLAVGSATGYDEGRPTLARLSDLQIPALADCPEISVAFIASDEPSFAADELAVAAVGPAIANALYSAAGMRIRHMPFGLALAPPPPLNPVLSVPGASPSPAPSGAADATSPDSPQPEVSL
ncbi:molybdopterin cofactor-binding domain-containing protein [Alteraurantiacibacter buctensis]|uniref:Molybdopterin-dependent oxidoreductase n=1 Tax=Alteraurantiacibacter buctensis TaxID=1503981 RepID=A0A844YTH6_9SPHN|nr:molybdopterin cofactor-binding domain-containing protein [Alteraurantiacibacter buctensis]MXO70171.1 molybdopterin-dependent oxidoreductase [Alteraurantiacibacter buctensis]